MLAFADNIRRYPFFRLIVPLLAGIYWQYYFPLPFQILNWVIISFILLVFVGFSKLAGNYSFRWLWGVLLFIVLFLAGGCLVQKQKKFSELSINQNIVYTGVIINKPQEREKTIRVDIEVDKYRDTSNVWHVCNERIVLYILNDSSLIKPNIGDELIFKTKLHEITAPQNPDEFDYRAYMARQGIFASAFVRSNEFEVINKNQLLFYRKIPAQIQQFVFDTFIRAGVTNNELAVITALTIGDKQYIDRDLKQSYASAGVVHLLAVSGLHVGVIFWALSVLLSFLGKRRKARTIRGIVILALLWVYAAVVGFSPSVTRATLMFSFLVIGQILGKQRSVYNSIAASAFFICIFNPYSIFDVGFLLSYAAVLGIVYFQPKIYSLLYFKQWLPNKLWSAVCVTLAAQLTTTPIVLLYFHQFPTYFLPANLILVFFTSIIIYVAVLLLAFSWMPFVLTSLGWVLANGLLILNKSVGRIEGLPLSLIDGVYINKLQCFILLCVVVLLAWYWAYRNNKTVISMLALLILFFGIRLHHKLEINNQQVFTVYSTNNATFIGFINGQSGYCLRDSLNIDNNFDYQTKNNLVKQGFSSFNDLTTFVDCNLLPFAYHNYIAFNDKIIYVADTVINVPKNDSTLFINVDYLLVSNKTKQNPSDLLMVIKPQLIIFDSSVTWRKVKQWTEYASKYNIACYNVKTQGAFVDG